MLHGREIGLQNMNPDSKMGEEPSANQKRGKADSIVWPRAGDSMNLVNRFSIFFEVRWLLESMYDVRVYIQCIAG